MQPWHQDGSSQCDIIAGGVDGSGVFKGLYVSGVHLAALLRTFQLSKVFLPVETATPVTALGQSLQDGIPLVIVTRGCFGRPLDYGSGPVRNDIQAAVWDAARTMRAEMPQVLVSCIDVPNNVGSEVIQACLEPPLNEYRELMFHDGTWYTPAVHNASSLAKWMSQNERMGGAKDKGVNFARKKFDWNSAPFANQWTLGWKSVLEVRPPAPVPIRTDLNFTEDAAKLAVTSMPLTGPSSAECTFQKSLAKARESGDVKELLLAAKFYLSRAAPREKDTIREAIQVAQEVSSALKSSGEVEEAFDAMLLVVGAKMTLNETDEALKVVVELKSSAPSAKCALQALRREVAVNLELGEVDKALEVARAGQAELEQKGDAEVVAGLWSVLADALHAKGEEAEATEARIKAAAN